MSATRTRNRTVWPSAPLPARSKTNRPSARGVPSPPSGTGTRTGLASGPVTYSSSAVATAMSSTAASAIGTRSPGRTVRGCGPMPDTCSNRGGASGITRTGIGVSVRSFRGSGSFTSTTRRVPFCRSGSVAVAESRSGASCTTSRAYG